MNKNKNRYREFSDKEIQVERIYSIFRDCIIYAITIGIIVGGYLLLTSVEVHASELKTTLKGNPNIDEMIDRFNGVDPLDKLAKAVAMHETHDCEDDTNFTRVNNCFGIRKWNGKKLVPAEYATKKDAYEDFKEIWGRMYGGRTVPTIADSVRWSGNDNAVAWHKNVNYFLKTL